MPNFISLLHTYTYLVPKTVRKPPHKMPNTGSMTHMLGSLSSANIPIQLAKLIAAAVNVITPEKEDP